MVPSVGVALRSCRSIVQAELVVEPEEGNQPRGLARCFSGRLEKG